MGNTENSVTIKLSACSGFPIINEIESYVNHIVDDISVQGYVIIEGDFVFYGPTTDHDAKAFLDRMLDDYATLGYGVEINIDLYDLNVYISDPELNAFYVNHRMNIAQTQTEALGDMLNEIKHDVDSLDKNIKHMDATITLNGGHKLREMITVIVDKLAEKGIFIGEDLNKVVCQTVH